jgi:hypothetical protein
MQSWEISGSRDQFRAVAVESDERVLNQVNLSSLEQRLSALRAHPGGIASQRR